MSFYEEFEIFHRSFESTGILTHLLAWLKIGKLKKLSFLLQKESEQNFNKQHTREFNFSIAAF